MRMDFLSIFAGFVAVLYMISLVTGQEGWDVMMPCNTGDTRPCGSNIGVCKQGIRECINGGWSECTGDVKPVAEICDNGLDDDCDGSIDECSTLSESVGPFLIIGGLVLFIISLILVKIS